MMNLIQKFKNLFKKPSTSDQERIEKWRSEADKVDKLKEEQRKARNQKKKGLTVEDFERAKYVKKQKDKTLSSNF